MPDFGSVYGSFLGTQQAQANLQATLQQTAERGVDTQLKQEQLKQIQNTASLGKEVAAAAKVAGQAGNSIWELNEASSLAAAKGDLTRASLYKEEANKLQKSSLDQQKEVLDIAVKERSARGDELASAMVSRDTAIEAAQNYLEYHKNPTTPEERLAQANRMKVLDQLHQETLSGIPWEQSPIRAEMDKQQKALNPEKERLRIEQLAQKKAADEANDARKQDANLLRELNLERLAAIQKEKTATKEQTDLLKKTNALNAEDHKYNQDLYHLEGKKDKLIEQLNKLEGLGQATIIKESGGWLGFGTTKTSEDTPAAQRIKTELSNLAEEKDRLDSQHEKALNRIDPENYPLTKPTETKPKETKINLTEGTISNPLPMPTSADKAIKDKVYNTPRGLAKWDGSKFIPVK